MTKTISQINQEFLYEYCLPDENDPDELDVLQEYFLQKPDKPNRLPHRPPKETTEHERSNEIQRVDVLLEEENDPRELDALLDMVTTPSNAPRSTKPSPTANPWYATQPLRKSEIIASPPRTPFEWSPGTLCTVEDAPTPASGQKKPKGSSIKLISNVVFYVALIAIVAGALIFSSKTNGRSQLLGLSYFEVLTPSMQSVLPVGSLVVDKHTEPENIQVGDIITYWRSDNETVTHEVISIVDDYEGTGMRGFQTKGRDNPEPDPDIVASMNVIGVVAFHLPGVGLAMSYIASHIGYVFIFIGLVLVISIAVRALAPSKKKEAGSPATITTL